jgi:hypothetical protein
MMALIALMRRARSSVGSGGVIVMSASITRALCLCNVKASRYENDEEIYSKGDLKKHLLWFPVLQMRQEQQPLASPGDEKAVLSHAGKHMIH